MPFPARFRPAVLALTLAAPFAPPVAAQQFGQGIDPNLLMMMDQMISSVMMNCQMGDQMSCQNAQGMQAYAAEIIGAGQYCLQYNDPNACGFYQQGAMNVQQAYMQMAQMQGGQMQGGQIQSGQMGVAPGYDPNAAHQNNMDAIANFGAQNTQNWLNQQTQNDANHNAFIDYIRQ